MESKDGIYGIYLGGELMVSYTSISEAEEAAAFATEETGIVHEVKLNL